jgi:hypothetical protein
MLALGVAKRMDNYVMSWWIGNIERLEYHCHEPKGVVFPRISLKPLSHPHDALTSKHLYDATCIIHH